MSWRTCATIGCSHRLREGLKRYSEGGSGQPLADGVFCWRCRAKHATPESRKAGRARTKARDEKNRKIHEANNRTRST